MYKRGPIVIIDDDKDDQQILKDALEELGVKNHLLFFDICDEALDYLRSTHEHPFLILSDINLPQMTGSQFKEKINADPYLRKKSIPFIFLTTSNEPSQVEKAYDVMVQGYFQKPDKMEDLKALLQQIVGYWQTCLHPNNTV